MSKCTVLAHVRNSNGEVVESNLFRDLLSHLPTRELAKEYYSVGTNQEFLDRVRDRANFDENGEITFASLRKLANINVSQEQLISTLNKQIGSGTYEYPQAIAKLQSFNRNSQFKDDFMATIRYNNEGKFELSIVPRTTANETALHEEIRRRSLQERIMYYLTKAGVSVEFMEKDDKTGGRYSTVNAQQTADGLYQLIRIANGERVTANLAEEAGHFVIGALGDSPLVKRLMELLTPEVQREALGDELNDKVLGPDGRREVAGVLIGKALIGGVDNEKPWQKMLHRVVNLAKRIFSVFRKGDNAAYRANLEATEIADRLARDFMSGNFSGSIENALKTRETLYSAHSSTNTKKYREVVNRLNTAIAKLRNISDDIFAEDMRGILMVTEAGRTNVINASTGADNQIADNIALDGIASALSLISDKLGPGKEIDNILKSIDFQNIGDFTSSIPEIGKKLRQVRVFASLSNKLQEIIEQACIETSEGRSLKGNIEQVQLIGERGEVVTVNLKEILRNLSDANKTLTAELLIKERQFFCRFCEETLGSNSVQTSAKVLFSREGRWGLSFEEAKEIKVSDVLEHLESDITLFERFLASASNSSDIITQIADRATKAANKKADDQTNEYQDKLRVLEARFKKLGFKDTSILFERSAKTGQLTGNIISEWNWGDYEDEYQEFYKKSRKEFEESRTDFDQLTEFERAFEWNKYFEPKYKEWYNNHFEYNEELHRNTLKEAYRNHEFSRLMSENPKLKEWYDDFMELKTSLDAKLPEGSTHSVRMPQFKGRFINRVKNQNQGRLKAVGHALRGSIRDAFCESSEDRDFGSNQTYNSEEEELFGNALAYEKEKINRLPIFGINKLQDMTELSTDLFHSTLAYASMANSYEAMSNVVDVLEVGKTVLLKRTVKGNDTEEERKGNKSRAYNRFIKFLDKQVYGISNTKHRIGKKIILEKVLATLSNLASKYFLGGNVFGGAVNTMTGFNELAKEAIAGEYFSWKDFKKANRLYWASLVDNWMEAGKDVKENKVSLFIRHFNTLNDSRQRDREWENDRNVWTRIYNLFGKSLFLPYKSGDHYMSTISYLALANKTMVYDEYGTKISLYEAYEMVDNTDAKGNKAGKTLALRGTYFKSADSRGEYYIIKSIISKIEASQSNPFGSAISLSNRENQYLTSKGYNLASTSNTLASLRKDADKLIWTATDESEFMDKAREINIRLHGIYNNQDKVAFSQNWYGSAVLAMRGYALGMLERRIGANKYSVALGQDVEGSLNTVAKVILSSVTDRGGFKLTARALLLPFGKHTQSLLYQAGFSANQVRNLKRNMGDAVLIGLLLILKCLSSLGDDDDDDENNIALGLLYYFSNRLYREQSAFNNPYGWYYESNTVLDMAPAGLSALIDIIDTGKKIGGLPFASKDNPDFYYQSRKTGLYEEGDSKGWNHMKRMTPYLRSVYTFEHPYAAAESYEYGRNVKAR